MRVRVRGSDAIHSNGHEADLRSFSISLIAHNIPQSPFYIEGQLENAKSHHVLWRMDEDVNEGEDVSEG